MADESWFTSRRGDVQSVEDLRTNMISGDDEEDDDDVADDDRDDEEDDDDVADDDGDDNDNLEAPPQSCPSWP